VFLPIYRKLGVYTAYEFLGQRFDGKTRLLGAGLFLLQRGLAAGVTIYAPAIILSTVLGWRLDLTIIGTGLLVIVYTVTGGSQAVSLTQKWQMGVIFGGMVTAFIFCSCAFLKGLALMARRTSPGRWANFRRWTSRWIATNATRSGPGCWADCFFRSPTSARINPRCNATSAVAALREGRLGLMFNALLKIPMQFSILLLGALLFVFYQFQPAPVFYNRVEWQHYAESPNGATFRALEEKHAALHIVKQEKIRDWLDARAHGDAALESAARAAMLKAQAATEAVRAEARAALTAADPLAKTKDSDYVFIGFILDQLPHGIIGLLIAVMIARRPRIEGRRTQRARHDHDH